MRSDKRTLQYCISNSLLIICLTLLAFPLHAQLRCVKPKQTLVINESSRALAYFSLARLALSSDAASLVVDDATLELITGEAQNPGIYLYNRLSQSAELLTVLPNGNALALPESWSVGAVGLDLSDDGRYVVFQDPASFQGAIYLRDRNVSQTILITSKGELDRISGDGKLVSFLVADSEGFSASGDVYDIATKSISQDVVQGLSLGGAPVTFSIARDGGSFYKIFKNIGVGHQALVRTLENSMAVYAAGAAISKEKRADLFSLPRSTNGVLTHTTRENIARYVRRHGTLLSKPLFFAKSSATILDVSTSGDVLLLTGRSVSLSSRRQAFSRRYLKVDLALNKASCLSLPANSKILKASTNGAGSAVVVAAQSEKTGEISMSFFSE